MLLDLEPLSAFIEEALRDSLGRYGYERADVRIGRDHDGDPTIYVVAHYRPDAMPVPPEAALSIATALNDHMRRRDDGRFVHLTHRWTDEQQFAPTRRHKAARRP